MPLTVGSVPKLNRYIVERGNIYTPKTHMHDRSLSWLGTDISINIGWVKLVLWAQ